jgi:exosome complex component RRP41
MDIGASFNSTLHHSESGWKVPFGDTARFLAIGDAVWAEIFMVDAAGSHQISLKKDDCRKLYSGTIVKIDPTNVSRVIGKQGSMITAIREKTQTRIQIGQNGYIWIDGKGDDISRAQKADKMAGQTDMELIKNGVRLDGRKPDELREVKIVAGVLDNADGSCYLEWGNNKIYAGVFGPMECHPRHKQKADRAIVQARYTMAPFSVNDRKRPGLDRRSSEISYIVSQAFEKVVMVEEFPKASIRVDMQVVEAHAGTRCAAMTAASVALADAGIPMRDMIPACASGKVHDIVVLDLNKEEDNYGQADLPLAIIPSTGEVVLLQLDGHLTPDQFEEAMDLATNGCMDLYEKMRAALENRYGGSK